MPQCTLEKSVVVHYKEEEEEKNPNGRHRENYEAAGKKNGKYPQGSNKSPPANETELSPSKIDFFRPGRIIIPTIYS